MPFHFCSSRRTYSFLQSARSLLFVLLASLVVAPVASAQSSGTPQGASSPAQTFIFSGYVVDAENGERLIGANVYSPSQGRGAATNSYGFFSFPLPRGEHDVIVSFLGYRADTLSVTLTSDVQRTIELAPQSIAADGVEVIGSRVENVRTAPTMSTVNLPIETLETVPVLAGEADVIKTLQLLPGTRGGTEGSSGLYVRGGSADQNLILLDGAPLYNATHLAGFFSVFNTDIVRDVKLVKGGFPARYGGRLSSVVDVALDEGNRKAWEVDGTLGLISSRLSTQGPVNGEDTAVLISGRRTYADLLARPFLDDGESAGYYFYDVNAKVNHVFSDQDRLYLSVYAGNDRVFARESLGDSDQSFGMDWGNVTTTLRWNHLVNDRLFTNTTLLFSRYRFNINAREEGGGESGDYGFDYNSGIRDVGLRLDADYTASDRHRLRFGGQVMHHRFEPGASQFQDGGEQTRRAPSGRQYALEANAYLEDDVDWTDRLRSNVGVHASLFTVEGTMYGSVQPRLSSRYLLTDQWTVKASYAAMQQYVHLLSNSTIGLPTDLWVPATSEVEPQFAHQAALGAVRTLDDGRYELSAEVYGKTMTGLLEYAQGASFDGVTAQDWETNVEVGTGRSYGGELLLRKTAGRMTGWIGYTLSWTDRQFDALNDGERFPYRYDRRHDLSVVLTHALTDGWTLSATWVYGTGDAVTLASGEFDRNRGAGAFLDPRTGGVETVETYGERNGFRLPAYHRLDLGARYVWGDAPGRHRLNLGVYNAYNHKNPFFVLPGTRDGQPVLEQYTLFPVLPSVSYSYSR